MAIKSKHFAAFLGSSALTRPLFVLGAASALLGSTAAQAFDANSLPQGGSVTGGSATIATSGKTLTVNQSSNRAVIDWRSFDIGSNAQANFNQPGTSSIAVNRVNGSVDPTRIEGGLHANGQVWVLNPNGVLFGKTARVDAAGVVATTANIDDKAFMAGSNRLQMTGGDHGQVVNEGHISVGQGGLAAFVAPSVRNSGTIRARVGKVALAAGDTYTLDLAGDRLVELGLGAGNAVVDQSGKVINAGGTVTITAKAAGQVVDSVINMSGVVDASAVKTAGGQIILGGDDINIASNATVKADGVSGGQITAIANKTGNYAGSYSAQGTTGDGGQIETSAPTVHIASTTKVNTKSVSGKTGNWTLDPTDFTVTNGGADATANSVSNTFLVGQLDTTDVSLQASNSITVDGAVDASGNAGVHNLALARESASNSLTITLNAAIKLKAGGVLSGDGAIVNVASTGLAQNGIDVAMTGGTVNLANATYREQAVIAKDLIVNGNGATLESPDILGHSFSSGGIDRKAVLSIEGANVNIANLTVDGRGQGNANNYFIGVGVHNASGSLSNLTVEGIRDGGVSGSLSGAQHGVGVAVYNDDAVARTVTLQNSVIRDFQKNGAVFTGAGLTGNVNNNTITGAGTTAVIAQNGILFVGATGGIGGNTIGGISYSPDTVWATAIYLSDADGTHVSNNIVNGAGGIAGSTLGLYVADSDGVLIGHNRFLAVEEGIELVAATNAVIDFNQFQNSANGIEADAASTGLSVNNNDFSGNLTHFLGETTDQAQEVLTDNNSFDRTVVATGGTSVYGSLQTAVDSEAANSTLNLSAGTFNEALNIGKNINLVGAGAGTTIIKPDAALSTGVGHKYDANVKTSVFVHDADDVNISALTIDGNGQNNNAVVFWNNASGSLNNVDISNPMAFSGAQTGQGLSVDATAGKISTLDVNGVTFHDWNKNAIDAVTGDGAGANGGTIDLTVKNSTFTGRGDTATTAQNGILAWEQGGGAVNLTVDNDSFTGINYTGGNAVAAGVLAYGLQTGSVTVKNSSFDGSVQEYIATGGGGAHEVDATTGNIFNGVHGDGATLDQLYAIEDKLSHGTDSTGDALVRIKAGNVYATASKDDLQDAIEAAAVGDTVNVQAGTYHGAVELDKANLTLTSGGAAANTIIDAGGAAIGINVATGAGNLGTLTVDGFTVNNWTSGGIIQSMNAGSLASMRITNNTVNGPSAGATAHGNGIEVTGDGSVVSGNHVNSVHLNSPDWSGSDIIVANGGHISVTNNVIDGDDTGIAVTNWNNTAGMSDITISGNTVSNVGEGISIQTNEGEYFGVASGPISGVSIIGNTISGNQNGIGVWDYSTAHNADWATTISDISGNIFTNNVTQISTDFTGADVTPLLNGNTFDRTVVNAAGGQGIYGDIQTAINTEGAGSTLNLAGTFAAGASVNQDGITLNGNNVAKIEVPVAADINGINIDANNVTVEGLEIVGPATSSYQTYGWSGNTRGIAVHNGYIGFNITDNNIHDIRNGILIDGRNTGSVTGNTIDNTKSGISVQYTDGAGIDISSNHEGTYGNEWGINLHLNGHYDDSNVYHSNSDKIASDADSQAQTQILNDSIFNNNWSVQDQGYNTSNRSAVTVATTGNDANQGSALTSLKTIQAGIGAVINGGTVNVGAGTYDEALDIEKALNIAGAGASQTIIKPTTLLSTGINHKYDVNVQTAVLVNGVGDVNISGVTIDSNNPGANATVFWNNAGGSIKDSEIANSAAPLGPQTGQGIAVDAGTDGVDPYQSNLTIDNVSFHNWGKNAIDAVTGNGVDGSNGGNISLTVKNSTFTGQGDTGLTAQNGILLWERGGGSVSATIDNSTFSDLGYTDPTAATAAGVLVYGVHNGAVSVSNSHFNNVQEYVATADSLNGVDATNGNTFDGVAADTATLDQMFAIEDHMNHGTEDATAGLVRVKAGQVYVTAAKGDIADSVAAASAGDTVNIQDGSYTLAGELDVAKALTVKGQSQAGTEITSNSTGYGIYVTGSDASLRNFTYNAPTAQGATYGIKVEPGTNTASDRVANFGIDHVTINGGYRTGLDLNGVDGATIDNVSVSGVVHGNGIALTDSANVTITNTDTSNNAWGGLALYQTNAFYDQQVDNISVDASNSFNDTIPVYAEDQSASKDFGSIALAGFDYVVKSPNDPADVYSWFQKTQQGAVNFATDSSLGNGNVNIPSATVQGYAGSGVGGDGHFTVGVGANGTAMSVNVALDQSAANDAIEVLNGTYAEDVALIAPRTVTFDDATLNSLSVLSTGAGSTLAGSVKADTITASTIKLGGDLSLDTSATNGAIAIALVDGAHDLTVNAGTGNVAFDRLGATTRLGEVDITAGITAVGSVNKAASFDFDGDVVVTHPTTLIDTTVSSTAAGNVTFGGDIYTLTDGGENLVISAGPGTGDKSANGDIVMKNAGGGFDSNHNPQRLGSLTVSGDDFSALTVNLKNDFTATLTGNQVFAADTLNAGGNVNSQVGGNATGHIVAGGNVNMAAGGDISGTISGQAVDLTAGNAISGNISGQTVSLTGQTANGQVTANTLNVNAAKGGAITGTFNPGTVSNGLSLNGQITGSNTGGSTGGNTGGSTGGNTGGSTGGNTGGTGGTQTGDNGGSTGGNTGGSTGGSTGGTGGTQTGDNGGSTGGNTGGGTGNSQAYVNGQQLVVENFVLPAGTQIGADGALILPQNVVIGLLSPGGGPARVIMVHDVGTLGALLAEGYVAIVIDLNKKKDEPVAVAAN